MAQDRVDEARLSNNDERETVASRWRKIMEIRIGIVPLPIFIAVIGLLAGFVRLGKVPADLTTNILTLAVGGFACAEIGKHIPVLRRIGAAAIFATFVPSAIWFMSVRSRSRSRTRSPRSLSRATSSIYSSVRSLSVASSGWTATC